MKKIILAALVFFVWTGAYSQVTIGGEDLPKAGAILDLNSTAKGGLVLSNVTIVDLEKIPYDEVANLFPGITSATDADVNMALRGAMVYNDGKNGTTVPAGIYIWNGYCWTVDGSCTVAAITAYSPASKSGVISGSGSLPLSVTPNGDPADFGYEWKNGNGTTVGTSQSYTATAMGTYSCTVTPKCGAPVTSDNFTVAVLPDDGHIGTGTFDGASCFDIVESNFDIGCGQATDRTRTNFATLGAVPYTFTATTTGVKNVRYVILDDEGCVDSPLSGTLEAGALANGSSVTLNISYKNSLNSDLLGRTITDAATVTIYIIYHNGSADVKVPLKVRIQDCFCCPGYAAVGGEYAPGNTNTYLGIGDQTTFATLTDPAGQWRFAQTGKSLCFYKTDGGYTSWTDAKNYCETPNTNFNGGTSGWRLPNIAELGAIQAIHSKLDEQPTSAANTQNMQDAASSPEIGYWSSTLFSDSGRTVSWRYRLGYTWFLGPVDGARVRCVKAY